MSKTPIYENDTLNALRQNLILTPDEAKNQGRSVNAVSDHSGLYNTVAQQPRRNFVVAGNNMLLTDSNRNCGIVIGSDRPSGVESGYGGSGATSANTIDLVVGRMSSNRKLEDGTWVNNSFSGDAARIYISQLTDIDTNFGCEPGQAGSIKGRAGIGIKADVVRIIGREGVKIVSGRSYAFKGHGSGGESNSRGGKISQPAPPIELIAGNTKSEAGFLGIGPEIRVLQGVAKGENVRDALRDISEIVDGLWAAVFNMALYNVYLFATLGINWTCPWYATMTAFTNTRYLTEVLNPLWHMRANKSFFNVNYTMPFGDKYVCSTNVFAT
jgi:hypothetical protein